MFDNSRNDNILETVTFDDGEVVTYGYNRGGQVKTVTGTKEHGNGVYPYVKDAGYDEFGAEECVRAGEHSFLKNVVWRAPKKK